MVLTCNFFCRLNIMFKILMFNCNRYRFDQLGVDYTYSFAFDDCRYSSYHEISVLRCKQNCRPHNMSGFPGNYFSSICCSCAEIDKDKTLLKFYKNKTLLKKKDLPKEFELIKIDNYLQKYVNADRHFFF